MTRSDDGPVTFAIRKINLAAASRLTDTARQPDHDTPVMSSSVSSFFAARMRSIAQKLIIAARLAGNLL